jgi:hypothetical protein
VNLAPSHAYLIVAVTVLALAVGVAGWQKDPWRVLVALGIGALALALLAP